MELSGKKKARSSDNGQSTILTAAWTKLSRDSMRHKRISEAVAKFIVLEMRPLNSVNDPGFTQLIKVLEPRYCLESRTHITQTMIPAMYDEIHSKVIKVLKDSEVVSLTTDGWSSRSS